jgi:hypothetical protein
MRGERDETRGAEVILATQSSCIALSNLAFGLEGEAS